jgi:hypothetical protein
VIRETSDGVPAQQLGSSWPPSQLGNWIERRRDDRRGWTGSDRPGEA